jgi:hypothetical protein
MVSKRNERIIHVGEYGTGVLYHPTELLLNYFHQWFSHCRKRGKQTNIGVEGQEHGPIESR